MKKNHLIGHQSSFFGKFLFPEICAAKKNIIYQKSFKNYDQERKTLINAKKSVKSFQIVAKPHLKFI